MTISDAQAWIALIVVVVPLVTTAIVTVYNTIATTRVEGKLDTNTVATTRVEGKLDTNTEITKTIETNTNNRLTEQDLLLRAQMAEIKGLTEQLHQLNAKLLHDEETRERLATETARGERPVATDATPSGRFVVPGAPARPAEGETGAVVHIPALTVAVEDAPLPSRIVKP